MLIFPKKFVGSCGWSESTAITRAIYRTDREIVIEFNDDGYQYLVELRSEDGRIFQGQFQAREIQGNDNDNGEVKGRVLWDESGPVIVGNWHEDRVDYLWFAKLNEVTNFPDEGKQIGKKRKTDQVNAGHGEIDKERKEAYRQRKLGRKKEFF